MYIDHEDRNLLSLVADYKGNIWFASGGMCVYPDRYPHGFAGYVEYDAVQKLLAGEARVLDRWLHGFDDTESAILETVDLVRNHPLVPSDVVVKGYIMDSTTGALTPISE